VSGGNGRGFDWFLGSTANASGSSYAAERAEPLKVLAAFSMILKVLKIAAPAWEHSTAQSCPGPRRAP